MGSELGSRARRVAVPTPVGVVALWPATSTGRNTLCRPRIARRLALQGYALYHVRKPHRLRLCDSVVRRCGVRGVCSARFSPRRVESTVCPRSSKWLEGRPKCSSLNLALPGHTLAAFDCICRTACIPHLGCCCGWRILFEVRQANTRARRRNWSSMPTRGHLRVRCTSAVNSWVGSMGFSASRIRRAMDWWNGSVSDRVGVRVVWAVADVSESGRASTRACR